MTVWRWLAAILVGLALLAGALVNQQQNQRIADLEQRIEQRPPGVDHAHQ